MIANKQKRIIYPPLFLCTTGIGIILLHCYTNFGFIIPLSFRIFYVLSSIYLLVSLGFIIREWYKEYHSKN